jgi:dihydrofolate synthase/folylpolyglutamate synthase
MRDKAVGEIAEILFPLAERVIVTAADNPRSATAEEIRSSAARSGAEMELSGSIEHAIAIAGKLACSDRNVQATRSVQAPVIVVTGSIYVVGEAMRALGVGADAK